MRENSVKRAWRDGKLTYGAWLSIPSSFSAEVMAHQRFDYVCVDMQHGVIDYQIAVTMLQAISTTDQSSQGGSAFSDRSRAVIFAVTA